MTDSLAAGFTEISKIWKELIKKKWDRDTFKVLYLGSEVNCIIARQGDNVKRIQRLSQFIEKVKLSLSGFFPV